MTNAKPSPFKAIHASVFYKCYKQNMAYISSIWMIFHYMYYWRSSPAQSLFPGYHYILGRRLNKGAWRTCKGTVVPVVTRLVVQFPVKKSMLLYGWLRDCQYKKSFIDQDCSVKIYALLTKREVKMAGYWPSSFLRFYGPKRSRDP